MAKILNKQMFNEDIKEEYLSTLDGYPDEGTAKIYRYAFYRSFPTEDTLGRDLYTFSSDEIEDALRNADHTTIRSIRLTFQAFKNYLRWAIENGYSSSNIMIIKTIKDNDLKNYLDNKNLYITDDKLLKMENPNTGLINYQDKVILRCIFEGIYGHAGSELLNLKKESISESNIVHLRDDKHGERNIQVSDRCIEFIERALNEDIYYNRNGQSKERWATSPLVQSNHVIKSIAKRVLNVERADKHTIYRRLTTVSEFFEKPYLTAKNVQKSGMIKMGKDLYKRDGELTNKQLAEIAEQFGLRTITVNDRERYNYSLIQEFVNRENILDLYGIDINE